MLSTACDLIQKDIRNNSAWNQRWFVCHRGKPGNQPLSLDMAQREADFAIDQGAALDPYNESPWRYLIGILREQHQRVQAQITEDSTLRDIIAEYEVRANALRNVLIEANRDPETCVSMTSARIDLLEMVGTDVALKSAILLAEGLANEYDTVKRKYWALVLTRLRKHEVSASI